MKHLSYRTGMFLLASVLGFVQTDLTFADPGDLDPTFDGDGIATLDAALGGQNDTQTFAVKIQPDGKIVTAGRTEEPDTSGDDDIFLLLRYNPDGSLDSSFDGDGIFRLQPGDPLAMFPRAEARDLVIQSDGKIVVAGFSKAISTVDGNDLDAPTLVRLNPDGSLDTAFDGDGIVQTDLEALSLFGDRFEAMALRPDGKIIAGAAGFVLARYTSNGSLDPTFGVGGIKGDNPFPPFSGANLLDLILQPDGKIVALGRINSGPGLEIVVIRYNGDGSVDTSFGTGGFTTLQVGTNSPPISEPRALDIQADGKIVVTATAQNPTSFRGLAIVRFESNGSLDSSFGNAGISRTLPTDPLFDYTPQVIFVLGDGRIATAGGASDNAGTLDMFLMLLNSDGSRDTNFGPDGNGIVFERPLNSSSRIFDLAQQTDGKLIAAGRSKDANFINQSAVLRYLLAPNVACVGFEPPLAGGPVKVKKNRVLPLKAEILDVDSLPLTDTELAAAPVLEVSFQSGSNPAVDVTGDALSPGAGSDGNAFFFDGSHWHFNLSTKKYTSPGTYTMSLRSGDVGEYAISAPTCTVQFVIN